MYSYIFFFFIFFFFFSSRRRHTRLVSDWSSDVCSSDLGLSPANHLGIRSCRQSCSAVAGLRAQADYAGSAIASGSSDCRLTKMLGRLIGAPISLHFTAAAELPFVHADAGMMEQVLMNLVINARDAMPDGGELFIELAPVTIEDIHARAHTEGRSGAFVCLTVRDTGSGIAPENLPRIFEPFFTTKAVGRGTGLGLATVYGIIKQHQGWVEVESVPGGGTTFRVFLPVVESPKGKMPDA